MTSLPVSTSRTIDLTHQPLRETVSRHLGGVALNGSLGASIVALALVALVVLGGVYGMFASALGGSLSQGQPKEVVAKLVATHTAKIDEYEKRFNNRSIFYKPQPAYKPPPPKPPEDDDRPPPPPPETGPPSNYGGPPIAWVIGDDVYFATITPSATQKYIRVSVGEESNGLKVINLEKMPRSVRVGYQGGEYDVKVFGESSVSSSLFPTTPKPSAFVPGFIPVEQPPPATPEDEQATVIEEEQPLDMQPDDGSGRPPPRNRGPRGERPQATPTDDKPD